MGGQVGRLFREFAVTLSAAVMISLVISLTTTPMMCAYLLRPPKEGKKEGRIARWFEAGFDRVHRTYEYSLDWALAAKPVVLLILVVVVAMTAWLYVAVPKGFFPQQDSGQIQAGLRADQSVSFHVMQAKLKQVVDIIRKDPASTPWSASPAARGPAAASCSSISSRWATGPTIARRRARR
jgi:multidrug efflux pump